MKFYCFRTISRPQSTFVPKGIPIGFQMAEKTGKTHTNRHTHTHFRIYISRDRHLQIANKLSDTREIRSALSSPNINRVELHGSTGGLHSDHNYYVTQTLAFLDHPQPLITLCHTKPIPLPLPMCNATLCMDNKILFSCFFFLK